MSKYNLSEFKDVTLWDKAEAIKYYLFNVPFEDQVKTKTGFWSDGSKELVKALNSNYCVSLVETPFVFSYSSLLSNFQWCCEFIYLNFSETTWEFRILEKLNETKFSSMQLQILLQILQDNPRPYSYPLKKYSSVLKFALLKDYHISRMDLINRLRDRDELIRKRLYNYFESRLKEINESTKEIYLRPQENSINYPNKEVDKELENERDNYLMFYDLVSADEKEEIINFLFELFRPYFKKEYSRDFFSLIFTPSGDPIFVELNGRDVKMNPQIANFLFSELKKEILYCTWKGIRKKFIALKTNGEISETVYAISDKKINLVNQRKALNYFSELKGLLKQK